MTRKSKTSYGVLVKTFLSGEITELQCLESLAKIGLSPCVLCDEKGRWSVDFAGMVTASSYEAESLGLSFYIEKQFWHPTIKEALTYSLKHE
jgi:hypothetical protein